MKLEDISKYFFVVVVESLTSHEGGWFGHVGLLSSITFTGHKLNAKEKLES